MKEDAKVKNAAIRKNEFEEKEVQKKMRKAEKNAEKSKEDDAKQGGTEVENGRGEKRKSDNEDIEEER